MYAGVAERTGVLFERNDVRRSPGFCKSVSELIRKARDSGDGYFYLPLKLWPAGSERVELQKPWIVVPSVSPPRISAREISSPHSGRSKE